MAIASASTMPNCSSQKQRKRPENGGSSQPALARLASTMHDAEANTDGISSYGTVRKSTCAPSPSSCA